ncbi:helix-turn-helix domain-containing protein [Chitinophaga nivalis]|uniref:Helix-turn-helix transcriptional regulator n=1 Tax=Chitinophaga nivalis TaxID=2991709 RepID=A0ABT3IIM7_9BACT|nr:helix-turn-helix transcriptional regulator [Chitinophaga nivalis]MCW3466517.1 helix-turn-helix transcriptional regulator [Chitinophaga nivalis]MCW3483792.1 helix-turn-helix transcriptional regulator [Chitinophaga nivalis]
MKTPFGLEQVLRILKKEGFDQGEVAGKIGYSEGHLSKVVNGEKSFSAKMQKAIMDEYGSYLTDIVVIDNPVESAAIISIRIESKIDSLAYVLSCFVEGLPDKEKKGLLNKLHSAIDDHDGEKQENKTEAFQLYVELAKKNAKDRAGKIQRKLEE